MESLDVDFDPFPLCIYILVRIHLMSFVYQIYLPKKKQQHKTAYNKHRELEKAIPSE